MACGHFLLDMSAKNDKVFLATFKVVRFSDFERNDNMLTKHQENSKMLSHAYLYLFALVLKIRSFFSYLGLKFIR